jgi:hypothetical protein
MINFCIISLTKQRAGDRATAAASASFPDPICYFCSEIVPAAVAGIEKAPASVCMMQYLCKAWRKRGSVAGG